MDNIRTDSILFRTIPPQLETVLDEFDYEEVIRRATGRGTVITYINEFVANNVYDYIVHWIRKNYLAYDLANITPNYADETQLRNLYSSRTSPARNTVHTPPPIVKNFYSYKSPTNTYPVRNYSSYRSPAKNFQSESVVNLYQPGHSQISSNFDYSLRELRSLNESVNSSRGRNARRLTSNRSHRSHPYPRQFSIRTHVPAFGTESFSRRSRNRTVRGGSSSSSNYSGFSQR